MHDLIIRGGTVVDGSGAERFQGDVAINDGTITEVGEVGGKSRQEIDAAGRLVTPGWVDVHTHYDGQATWDPLLAPSVWHGVTTVVMGNCGVGFAPVRPGSEQFLIELMEGVEDIPGAALAEGIDWQWRSFPEYLDALEAKPRAIDVAAQVPHGAVRAYSMGERCNDKEAAPTESELEEMQTLVREGLEAGALGFTSSRTWLHTDRSGVHVPGTFAGSDEMLALGMAMKGLDHGVFELVSDYLGNEDEWQWIKNFSKATGRPVTLVSTSPRILGGGTIFDVAEQARTEGVNVRPQMAGRPTGVLHGLQSSFHVFMRHPTYLAELKDLPHAQKVARMQEPAIRAKILAEESTLAQTMLGVPLDKLLWHVFPLGENPNYEPDREQSVAGIAEREGTSPFEVMYDLLVGGDGKELFYQPLGGYDNYNFERFFKALQHPSVLFGLSDGGAHCGVIADAGMPSFILSHWARDRTKGEQLPLEFLVRKLSADTAAAYGMADRGILQPGFKADINVIDFDALALARPEAIFDLPTGGKRLVQRVTGYDAVIKNGEQIMAHGEHTGALPGTLVRGG
jgi:N-acyl-D-aspartate/D-glutamate deacylase